MSRAVGLPRNISPVASRSLLRKTMSDPYQERAGGWYPGSSGPQHTLTSGISSTDTPNGDGHDHLEQPDRRDENTTTLRRTRRRNPPSDFAKTKD